MFVHFNMINVKQNQELVNQKYLKLNLNKVTRHEIASAFFR